MRYGAEDAEKNQEFVRGALIFGLFRFGDFLPFEDGGHSRLELFSEQVLSGNFAEGIEEVVHGNAVDVEFFRQGVLPAFAVIDVYAGKLVLGDEVVELLAVGVERNPDDDEIFFLILLDQLLK